jgi:hypothetical protein
MTQKQKDTLRYLADTYGLSKDHVFVHKHYTILNRAAIDKIQLAAGISIDYYLEYNSQDLKCAVIKATGTNKEGVTLQTFGEASPANNQNAYPIAMAEKRAMSRIVLKLAGVYGQFVFGEDESEEFKNAD